MKSNRTFNGLILTLLLLILSPLSAGILAQDPVSDSIAKTLLAIPVSKITPMATEVNSYLRGKRNVLYSDEQKKQIEVRLNALVSRLHRQREDPRIHRIESISFRSLDDLETDWGFINSRLRTEQKLISSMLHDLDEEISALEEMSQLWKITLASTPVKNTPLAVIHQIEMTITDIDSLITFFQKDTKFLQNELASISSGVIFSNEILDNIYAARDKATKNLLSLNKPPIWKEFSRTDETTVIKEQRSFIEDSISGLSDFVQSFLLRLVLHILLSIALIIMVYYSFRNLAHIIPEGETDRIKALNKITHRPLAAGFLIAFFLTFILYGPLDDIVKLINMACLLVPLLLILRAIIDDSARRFIYVPLIAMVLIQIHSIGNGENLISRLFLLFIILFILGSLVYGLARKSERKLLMEASRGNKLIGFVVLGMGLMSISLVSIIIGGVMLAEFLTYSLVRSATLALVLYSFALTLNSIITIALYSKGLQKISILSRYKEAIYTSLIRLISLASWILWIILTLRLFNIWKAVYGWINGFLTYIIKIGSVEFSLLNLILFFFIIWLTLSISRLIHNILEGEDLLRDKMKKGVPAALSLITRVIVITVGFLIAIAAAGFEMSKLTILLGAFGVGIGFGLQNIFNNLVSGIILVFERPIKEGDIIEVGAYLGVVKQIGIRASTIRTVDGSEVIVPNGNLISNELINWTHTDQIRRLNITIGVKYGTDPEKVLKILNDIANEHPEVLKNPPHQALFTEHGESSLNFKLLVWIPNADERMRISSEITLSINKALKNAGIEIPFPQRDLHVRSMDEKLLKGLSGNKSDK